MQFQTSGLVSDESAQAIGRMLGAQYIISGSMEFVAGFYRFRIQALSVENAVITYSGSRNVANDRVITSLTTTPTTTTGSGSGAAGDFAAAERNRARWLNIFWGAGSFSQRDILGGSITALLDVGGLVCIGFGVGSIVTRKHHDDSDSYNGKHSFDGKEYREYDEAEAALEENQQTHIRNGLILLASGTGLSIAGLVYGFIRPSVAHRSGFAMGDMLDPAHWNLALVSDDRGEQVFRLTYRMSF
jgi:hypothetical protein